MSRISVCLILLFFVTLIVSAKTKTKALNGASTITLNRPYISNTFDGLRYKRKASDRSIESLRKKLADEKKLEEIMAMDGKARLEPNRTLGGTLGALGSLGSLGSLGALGSLGTIEPSHYGDIKNEQQYNLNRDKIRMILQQTNHESLEQPSSRTNCNFEDDCDWTWRKDIHDGFFIAKGQDFGKNETGPRTDSNKRDFGSFLILRVPHSTAEFLVTSPLLSPTSNACRLHLWIYQEAMESAQIRVVGDKIHNIGFMVNHTQWFIETIHGNDNRKWTKHVMSVGKMSENFTILLEVVPPQINSPRATVAFDDISLTNCYPQLEDSCSKNQYMCFNSSKYCINSSKICDLTPDCPLMDDELRSNCDQIPYGARCSFEEDWCGWYNIEGKALDWQRHNGSTPTNETGPNYDHTYMNTTGKYLYVNMLKGNVGFAGSATLKSIIFNPPPRVHGNLSSRYFNSCAIRFFLHQTGKHKSALQVTLTELKPNYNETKELLWSYNDHGDRWVRQIFILPNITNRYFINFEVRRGVRYISDIAIDDVSLSPECFGLNIPSDELQGYNYWNPRTDYGLGTPHNDFANETYYKITSCGATGRYGPSIDSCSLEYRNKTTLARRLTVVEWDSHPGIQKWKVPIDGYYTFLIFGASGGKGSGGIGSSRGAMVRTVMELTKDQEILMLIGQEGSSACPKQLNFGGNSSCLSSRSEVADLNKFRGLLKMNINDTGGGGGGGTYVLMRNGTKPIPLAIAGGGGGLGVGNFIDTGHQHGQAINMSRHAGTGTMHGKISAGAGGGWKKYDELLSGKDIIGRSFQDGGVGGKACYNSTDGRGDGGFGGGGGGCSYGGGGGGYSGGDASTNISHHGSGGYSYLDPLRSLPNLSEAHSGYNSGPGYILIIPAISGCGCDFRCIALDPRRSNVVCICPKHWKLDVDGKTCIPVLGHVDIGEYPTWFVIGLVACVLCLTIAFGVVCFLLYNRYQVKASGMLRRKMMSGADLQLDRLRNLRMASDGMMTEYNPNYEFGGVVYTLRDLKDIPRNQLRLVKALGQGAFGEVYQGFYRQRPCDTVEMPVAVKTLPEMSTSQAEMDFLMEALIMSKFNHPNIVHFIGVCFDKHPRFIVLELLAGGDLKNFLRESRPKPERGSSLTMKDMIYISIDIAKGCKYLEDNRFIHRDIAARNCLLTTKGPGRVVKIADFGMSRDVYRSDYYRKGGKAMLPIKWMPPEAFLDGIFSTKTDVWSFGVLLWEVMSMGYMPYTGCANKEVMNLVTNGGRLDPPVNCPGPIYGIMTQCWHPTPEERPTFKLILERLGYCEQDPAVMNAPLPVFYRPPSLERDTTVMRPDSDDCCLQVVPQSSDYLIPSHSTVTTPIGTSSIEKLLPDNSDSWETSFIMPHSKSTQPLLLEKEDDHNATNADKFLEAKEIDHGKKSPLFEQKNGTSPQENGLKTGVSLNAGALIKQSPQNKNKFNSQIKEKEDLAPNGILHKPYPISTGNNYLINNKKMSQDSEINC